MADQEIRDLIKQKVSRFKDKLHIKDLQFNVLLEISNAINANESTLEILERYERFVKEELKIDKIALYAKYRKWRCLLEYGVPEKILDAIDVDKQLIGIHDIESSSSVKAKPIQIFDMIVPVFSGNKALAYLLLGDPEEETEGMSSIIKHLNFLQLLTNVMVSAIENQRLQQEALKQEKEKQKLIEEQNEMLEQQVAERTSELNMEKEESERLLNNILPKKIADELKKKGTTTPQRFGSVSVLFTDFKDFTARSAKTTPQELVGELNDIFRGFDQIMDKHGIEKIKTIGDAYMAVSGIPEKTKDHAIRTVNAVFEMIEFLDLRNKASSAMDWHMRAGVHSGPLVAGVVGTKKFTYDVWGDSVNTASRMESNGEPGKLNISAGTYKLIKNDFKCKHRGKITAKGKGLIDMYFVERKRDKKLEALQSLVLGKLKDELPEYLTYHGIHHTLDVYSSTLNLAGKEKVSKADLKLLKVAALYHDVGFIKVYDGHEAEGCKLVKRTLPKFGFSDRQIKKICGMIIATKIPQSPKTHLEQILCDADLDYLGRDDFIPIAATLRAEWKTIGNVLSDEEWIELQVNFLSNHQYFTDTAKEIRSPIKEKHLFKIKKIRKSN